MVKKLLLSNKKPILLFLSLLLTCSLSAQENRSIDGSSNNLTHPEWGAVGTSQLHEGACGFADGISSPAGEERPNPRVISNQIFAQDNLLPDAMELSDYAWVWGQFIDHDITLSDNHETETLNISVPIGDIHFDPASTGTVTIDMNRSLYDLESGTSVDNPRAYPNGITAFIDGSGVYGSDEAKAS